MRKVWYSLFVSVLLLTLGLASCAAPATPATVPVPQAPTAAPQSEKPGLTREQQLIEGAKKEGEVVVWTSTVVEGAMRDFQNKYPFLKLKLVDTRADVGINKIKEEAKIGRHSVDIVLFSETDVIDQPLGELFQQHDWPNTKGWPSQPSHQYYRNYIWNARAPIYNSNLMPSGEVPKSWEALADPKWRDNTVVSTSANEMPIAMAYIWRENGKLNWEKSESYWQKLVQNTRPKVGSGFTGQMEMIAAGERLFFVGGSLTVFLQFKLKGAPLEIAPTGTLVGYNRVVALVANAPHSNAARLFADWLTSTEGLATFAEVFNSPVIPPEVAKKTRANREVDRLGFDILMIGPELLTGENAVRSNQFWLKVLGFRG